MPVYSQLQGSSAALRAVMGEIDAQSCPYAYNFHLHTVYSDGQLQPDVLMQQAVHNRLSGLAITDHHSVEGYIIAQEWLDQWQQLNSEVGPQLWPGVEITALLCETEVHILGYDFEPNHPQLQGYLQGKRASGVAFQAPPIIAAIHQAGGLAILAHPARYRRSPAELIPAAVSLGIDGVETYYCYGQGNPWRPSPRQTEQVRELGQRYQLIHTCGTDTHGLNILRRL